MSVLSSLSVDEKLDLIAKTDKFHQKYVYKRNRILKQKILLLVTKGDWGGKYVS